MIELSRAFSGFAWAALGPSALSGTPDNGISAGEAIESRFEFLHASGLMSTAATMMRAWLNLLLVALISTIIFLIAMAVHSARAEELPNYMLGYWCFFHAPAGDPNPEASVLRAG